MNTAGSTDLFDLELPSLELLLENVELRRHRRDVQRAERIEKNPRGSARSAACASASASASASAARDAPASVSAITAAPRAGRAADAPCPARTASGPALRARHTGRAPHHRGATADRRAATRAHSAGTATALATKRRRAPRRSHWHSARIRGVATGGGACRSASGGSVNRAVRDSVVAAAGRETRDKSENKARPGEAPHPRVLPLRADRSHRIRKPGPPVSRASTPATLYDFDSVTLAPRVAEPHPRVRRSSSTARSWRIPRLRRALADS